MWDRDHYQGNLDYLLRNYLLIRGKRGCVGMGAALPISELLGALRLISAQSLTWQLTLKLCTQHAEWSLSKWVNHLWVDEDVCVRRIEKEIKGGEEASQQGTDKFCNSDDRWVTKHNCFILILQRSQCVCVRARLQGAQYMACRPMMGAGEIKNQKQCCLSVCTTTKMKMFCILSLLQLS